MKPIYLEPDEEITSIIDRLSKVSETKIAVVVPKNSTMFQSLVNLKLLARQAKKLGKSVAIISGNKVGGRLAKQVGLETYASLGVVSVPPSSATTDGASSTAAGVGANDTLPDGTPIHRYSAAVSTEPLTADEDQPIGQDEARAETQISTAEPVVSDHLAENINKQPVASSPLLDASLDGSAVPNREPEAAVPLPAIVSRPIKTTPSEPFVFPWKSALVAAAMILVAAIITFLFLPKATVTLTFPAKLVSETFVLAAKTDVTQPSVGTIAGSLLTVDRNATKDVVATGKKDIGTKSGGSISAKNCEDTNSHFLAAGSKTTASGKGFTTNSSVTIPAGTFSGGGTVCTSNAVNVSVTASEAGEGYNLSAAVFTFTGLSNRVSATGSTTGGTTKQITVLAQSDVDAAYAELKQTLLKDATTELKDKAGAQTVLDEAIEQIVVEQKVDKEVGRQTDTASASVALELYTIAFDRQDVETASRDKLTEKLEANQQLIVPSDKKPTFLFKDLTADKTTLNLEITASGFVAPLIDKVAVARSVNNRSIGSAEAMLKNQYQVEEIGIEIIPGWWIKRLPILSQAISVEYGFNELPAT